VLNENGRVLLPLAASLLDQAAELEHLFTGAHEAPLRVAASLTIGEYLLPEVLARWKAAHPASPVQLMIANTSDVIAAVAAFDVDVGFVEGTQTHPSLVVHPWLTDELVIVAAPDHP
jgi:DNA-binding transcriptional LysR family regulator